MFAELNKKVNSVEWGIDTKDYEYRKCADVKEGKVNRIYGLFITPDNGYGLGAVAIMDGFLLNLPARYVELVQSILSTESMIEAIKEGKCGINVTTFDSKKYKRKGYDVEFVDI